MKDIDVRDALEILLSIGAVIAMIYGWLRWLWPLIKGAHRMAHRLEATVDAVLGTLDVPGMPEKLEEMRKRLNEVAREVRPNGGSSMNDAVVVVRGELRALLDADNRTARWSADRNGKLTWVSKAYTHWTGAGLHQIADNGWLSLVHPDDRETIRDEWRKAIEERRGSSFRFRLSDGRGQWLDVFGEASPIANGAGAVIGWSGTLQAFEEAIL